MDPCSCLLDVDRCIATVLRWWIVFLQRSTGGWLREILRESYWWGSVGANEIGIWLVRLGTRLYFWQELVSYLPDIWWLDSDRRTRVVYWTQVWNAGGAIFFHWWGTYSPFKLLQMPWGDYCHARFGESLCYDASIKLTLPGPVRCASKILW